MAITPFSFRPATVYTPSTSPWTAVHAGYTEIASKAAYVESAQEWTGSHSSYDDIYIPSEPETDPVLPDMKAMMAMMKPVQPENRSLEEAILNCQVSSDGTLRLSLQRDLALGDQALPQLTTSIHLNVLGTGISSREDFSTGLSTMDLVLRGLPSGVHTVEVEAYANGKRLGTTRLTITVPEREVPPPVEELSADRVDKAPALLPLQPRPPQVVSAVPTAQAPVASPTTFAPQRAVGLPRAGSAWKVFPTLKQPEDLSALDRADEPNLGGQAMAGGLGGALSPSRVQDEDTTVHESVQAIGAIREGGLQGQGDHRPPRRQADPEPGQPEGV